MRRTTGGNAQDRRRRRRAAQRRSTTGIAEMRPADVAEIRELVAAASAPADDSSEAAPVEDFSELYEILGQVVELGGKPSKGTKADKRLKENPEMAEDLALEALDAYRAAVRCSCGHAFSEHSGANGTCGHTDGRGTCRCGEFAHPEVPDAEALATAYVKIRPDLEGFEAEVERAVRRAIRSALAASAGDVAWGPEEGFLDLLCDVNEILGAGEHDDEDGYGPHAVDASVALDKVLIYDGDDRLVAPISIDADGEPVLSDRSDWVPVEKGWIETPDDDQDEPVTAAARLRFALRDFVVADGATAPPIPDEHQPDERLPAATDAIEPPAAAATGAGEVRWTATFVPEGVLTEDGRAFAPGALILPPEEGSRELPLSLMAMVETSAEGGHDGARVAGRIDQLWRDESSLVKAAGVFSEEEYGQMIARMVGSGELRGLSVDVAPLEWEQTPASDWFDEDGRWIAERGADGDWTPAGEPPTLEEAVERLFGGEDMILLITKGVIGAATVCPFPAFGQASISLAASGSSQLVRYAGQAGFIVVAAPEAEETVPAAVGAPNSGGTMTASGGGSTSVGIAGNGGSVVSNIATSEATAPRAPVSPPIEWFDDPELEELTPLTITEDGRIFGHAWQWGTCHLSFDECVVAPRSETEYAYFRLGEVECSDGDTVAVGKVTLDTSHAGQRLSRAEATRHYDHTGTVAAHVAFGEDEFGGWFAGSVSPDLSEEKLRLLRGATISGDWRGVDGNLELVALLAVNVPGFPVPRSRALVAAGDDGGEILALTAAGIVYAPLLSEAEADEIRRLAAGAE